MVCGLMVGLSFNISLMLYVKQARINGLSLVTGLANFRHCLVIFLLTRWGGILVIWLALYLGGMG